MGMSKPLPLLILVMKPYLEITPMRTKFQLSAKLSSDGIENAFGHLKGQMASSVEDG